MVTLLCLLLMATDGEWPRIPETPPVTTYIGAINIWGNIHTEDGEIRQLLESGPGQRLDPDEWRRVEWRLLLKFPDRFAWWTGDRPRVKLGARYGEGEMRFQDLRIEFPEMKKR